MHPQNGGSLGLWSLDGETAADEKGVLSEAKRSFALSLCQHPAWEGVAASEGLEGEAPVSYSTIVKVASGTYGGGGAVGRQALWSEGQCVKSWE